MAPLLRWALAFAFTQAVEVPIYRAGAKLSVRDALAATALTHPVVWFVIPPLIARALRFALAAGLPRALYGPAWTLAYGLVGEGFAVLVEALWLKRCGCARPLRWSLAANVVSASVGVVSSLCFGFP